MPVNREELEALFLSLDEEEFVERVLVSKRGFERSGGVRYGQQQKSHMLIFKLCLILLEELVLGLGKLSRGHYQPIEIEGVEKNTHGSRTYSSSSSPST